VLQEVHDADGKIVLFLDELHTVLGAGGAEGAMVVVRPDQSVANVLPLDALDELSAFFGGFLVDCH